MTLLAAPNYMPMNLLRHASTALICLALSSCIPGKFASGVEGVIVDSRTSNPVSGAIVESRIPHKDDPNGAASSVTTSDQDGRFSFRPVYGIYKLLMMPADWRELRIDKDGYKELRVFVIQQDGVRMIEIGGQKNRIESPLSEDLRLGIYRN